MAKSAPNPSAPDKPGDVGLEVENISATAIPNRALMRRRNAPAASDDFGARYVSRPSRSPVRGRSGRYSGSLADATGTIPAGARPRTNDFHDARLHRDPAERRQLDRERERNCVDWGTQCRPVSAPFGGAYPAPVYNGSSATAGMTPDDVRAQGRIPVYPHDFSEVVAEYGD